MASPDLEEALRRSEELAARLIESSRDCIKVLDLNGHLLSMNAHGMTALEICDFGPLVGSPWIEFWDGQDREQARAAVEEARQGRVGRFTGFFATAQTKTPKWWDVSVTAILGKDGKPEQLLAISRDVTRLKEAEQAIQQAYGRLEQQVAARTRDLAQTGLVLRQIVEGVESKSVNSFFPRSCSSWPPRSAWIMPMCPSSERMASASDPERDGAKGSRFPSSTCRHTAPAKLC